MPITILCYAIGGGVIISDVIGLQRRLSSPPARTPYVDMTSGRGRETPSSTAWRCTSTTRRPHCDVASPAHRQADSRRSDDTLNNDGWTTSASTDASRYYVGRCEVAVTAVSQQIVSLEVDVSLLWPLRIVLMRQNAQQSWGPIYKISYDLSWDYRKFIVRSTYDSDLKSAKISFRDIVS